jgi:dihydrofolate reductase
MELGKNVNFSVIVAHDLHMGIGKKNDLPWQCRSDLRHFSKVTKRSQGLHTSSIIMGRGTYESIGSPLPDRVNIVVSSKEIDEPNVFTVGCIEDALAMSHELKAYPYIIGGGQVYKYVMKKLYRQIDTLHVTLIIDNHNCDTFFPEYRDRFIARHLGPPEREGDVEYRFCVYGLWAD